MPAKSVAGFIGAATSWDAKEKKIMIKGNESTEHLMSLHYTFDQTDEGWKGAFADLPVDYDPSIFELQYARELLPLSGNKMNYGLKLKGMNRSDDLFMFVTKKVEGLEPNKVYGAELSFKLYTNQAGGMVGIGGAPGEAVTIKAGVVNKEPLVIEEDDGGGHVYYRMNIDKGNQVGEGADMKAVGNMVKSNDETEDYEPVEMRYSTTLTSNAQGELFVIIGSDSGYEGLTVFYLDDMKLHLSH